MSRVTNDWWLKGKLIELIERITLIDEVTLIDTITTIATITAISNIVNIQQLELVDVITLIETINSITSIGSIGEIGAISRVKEPVFVKSMNTLPSTQAYDFVDINSPSASHVAKFSSNIDTTTKELGTEYSSAQYDNIEASDVNKQSHTAATCRLRCKFIITESIEDITELKLTFEGNASIFGRIYLWNYVTEKYDWKGNFWSTEIEYIVSVKTDIADYVDDAGEVWFLLSCAASLSTDYIKLDVVSFSPTAKIEIPVNIVEWGGTDLTGGDITSKINNLDIALSDIDDAIDEVKAVLGEVQASPTTNTVLYRLKLLEIIIGEVQATPTTYTLLSRLKQVEDGIDEVKAELVKSTTPAIYNVTMTNADTEYSQALPTNCKKFSIHTRTGTAFRIAFATGKVAAPTEPYWTMNYGVAYWENDLNLTAVTVYFACDADGVDVEIIAWA